MNATPEAIARLRAELGLDGPVIFRYFRWLGSALRGDFRWIATARGLTSALALGFFPTAVPYFCFAAALTRISVAQSYAISLLEPVTAALLGVFLLGERLSAVQMLGMALEFACMILSSWDAVRRTSR